MLAACTGDLCGHINMATSQVAPDCAGPSAATIAVESSFLLNNAKTVWLVEEGQLDIFIQNVAAEPLKGALRHLRRLPPGQAAFGIDASSNDGFVLVARPGPNTRLRQLSFFQSTHPSNDQSLVTELSAWIDCWVEGISQAICKAQTPKTFVQAVPNGQVETGDLPQAVAPRQGVVWIQLTRGTSMFLARTGVPISAARYFPASKYTWLEVAPNSSLDVTGTSQLLEGNLGREALASFHEGILAAVTATYQSDDLREQERLETKASDTREAVRESLIRLASSLTGKPVSTARADISGDVLLRACRAVGQHEGIEITTRIPATDAKRFKNAITSIARVSFVRVRRVLLRGDWWKHDCGSFVAFRDSDDRPLALLSTSNHTYELYDPVDGSAKNVDSQLAATLSGVAYSFYRPFPSQALPLKELLSFGLSTCKREIVIILLLGIAGAILNLVPPIGMGLLFDSAIPGAQRDQILMIAAILVVSAISMALFTITRNLAVLRLEGKLDATLQPAAWDRLLRAKAPFFRQFSSGDLALRSMAFSEIREVLAGSLVSLIFSQLFSLLGFVLLFVYSWQLALLALGLVLVAGTTSTVCLYIYLRHARDIIKHRGRLSSIVLEFIGGISKFRVSGTEGRAFSIWARTFAQRKAATLKARRVWNSVLTFNASWPILCSALIFYYGFSFVAQPQPGKPSLSTGQLLAFFVIFNQTVLGALQLAEALFPILGIFPHFERAKPILMAAPEVDNSKAHPGELTGNIEVSHLAFQYDPAGPPILRDVNCSIRAGQLVAFVGASGGGKSTLLRLLLGFETPQAGGIYYDGQDMAGLDVEAVRQQMGVVLQGSKLSSGTLLTQIIGSSSLTIDDAWAAARMTGLESDISAMPTGMHTVVGEGGATLSGGQKQRLAIARAIVAKPRILLFDEATSALDNETQAIVTRSLDSLRATRVVIAHRLSTIMKADCIMVLDEGRIVQSGTYDELISQPGLFKELAGRQLLG